MKYIVTLRSDERERLERMVRCGTHAARTIRRAQTLLRAEEGNSTKQIAELLRVSPETVRRTRKRFATEGLEATLQDRPRSGQPRRLDRRGEAHLIALACSDAPEGRTTWTMQLLADGLVEIVGHGISPVQTATCRLLGDIRSVSESCPLGARNGRDRYR